MSENIITVSELNNYLKNVVEKDFYLSRVYVKGEICNLNKHYSGNYFFTLKDENSKVNCTMFASYVNKLKIYIKDGDEVLIYGKLQVFEKNGSYNISIYSISLFGEGQYLAKLNALKEQLLKEGLFTRERKKLALMPQKIGILASSSGAAVHDLIHTITSRYTCDLYVFNTQVQGLDAPKHIIKRLKQADEMNLDVLILARGGGSNEDLKAFNDEELVRYIVTLKTPLISAIGHEIDKSLVDLVSDVYAITPTDAGEKVSITNEDILVEINYEIEQAYKLMNDYISQRENLILQLLSNKYLQSPESYIKELENKLEHLTKDLNNLIRNKLKDKDNILKLINIRLDLSNPYHLLDKGYSLVTKDNKIVKSIKEINNEDELIIRFKDGEVKVKVEDIINGKDI